MPGIGKILLSCFIGGVGGAILGFFTFFLLALGNGTKTGEAFAYSLIVGFGCAVIGVLIGLVIGVGNLGAIGGGIVGVLATLCVAAFYVFYVGRPGEQAYFLRESKIIFVVLTLPTILTGIITALLKNTIYRT